MATVSTFLSLRPSLTKLSQVLATSILTMGLPIFAGANSALAQTCNPFGCSQPGAAECNPFGCPNPGAPPCNPFGCPASPSPPPAKNPQSQGPVVYPQQGPVVYPQGTVVYPQQGPMVYPQGTVVYPQQGPVVYPQGTVVYPQQGTGVYPPAQAGTQVPVNQGYNQVGGIWFGPNGQPVPADRRPGEDQATCITRLRFFNLQADSRSETHGDYRYSRPGRITIQQMQAAGLENRSFLGEKWRGLQPQVVIALASPEEATIRCR